MAVKEGRKTLHLIETPVTLHATVFRPERIIREAFASLLLQDHFADVDSWLPGILLSGRSRFCFSS